MKKTKRFVGAVCLSIMMAMVTSSIVPSLAGTVTVEAASKVKLNKTKATLYVGKSTQLKVKGTTKKVTWKSSNKKVATVTSKGKVTAKKKGKAIITAKVSGKKYTCKVTVKDIALKSISLNKTSVTLDMQDTYKLKVKYSPTNTTVKKEVTWISSNTDVAIVDEWGEVYACNAGKTTITAKVGNKKAKCTVTVKEQPSEDSSNDDSSSDDNSKEDTTKERTPAENLNILKAYIVLYGSVNSNGDKYIEREDSMDGNKYKTGIVYIKEKDKLQFIYYGVSDKYKRAMNMYVDFNEGVGVSPEYILTFQNVNIGCRARATFDATKYNQNDTVHFELITGIGLSEDDIQDVANAELRASFAGWNLLLVEKTGLQLSDIGFTSYK
ncbi:MAG: Ig domain-containing protein [Lachnospiraceae bacterium]|nr:Ig domain-containing protein [Lachnospiraceae bacterium]